LPHRSANIERKLLPSSLLTEMGISYSNPSPQASLLPQDFDPASYFKIKRLNSSTHVIQEQDSFNEYPLIYVKQIRYPHPYILICDTGCGTAHRSDGLNGPIHNLRSFIETYPAPSNSHEPLNPHGRSPYLILCSHCHYDHILAIPQFVSESSKSTAPQNATVVASSHCPSFLSPKNLPRHSLCSYLGFATPRYDIGVWAGDRETLAVQGKVVGHPGSHIITLHIPGHTPDSLGWFDELEKWIYIGDTFYERHEGGGADGPGEAMPIEFDSASGADLVAYMETLDKLLEFVKIRNNEDGFKSEMCEDWEFVDADTPPSFPAKQRVRAGCAHVTSDVDAEESILAVQEFFRGIFEGKIPFHNEGEDESGEAMGFWEEAEGHGKRRFSVLAPLRLVEEAKKHFHICLEQA
jgi:glyoxylase-like metal-dependent hydrolase (beta-lactamase superfamily II)